jgi:hypothetical protein
VLAVHPALIVTPVAAVLSTTIDGVVLTVGDTTPSPVPSIAVTR